MLVVEILGVTPFSQTESEFWKIFCGKLEKKMKQTGGRLLWLKFKKVRGAKMKCLHISWKMWTNTCVVVFSHFKPMHVHFCLCVWKHIHMSNNMQYSSKILFIRIHIYINWKAHFHMHTHICTWLIIWFTVFVK